MWPILILCVFCSDGPIHCALERNRPRQWQKLNCIRLNKPHYLRIFATTLQYFCNNISVFLQLLYAFLQHVSSALRLNGIPLIQKNVTWRTQGLNWCNQSIDYVLIFHYKQTDTFPSLAGSFNWCKHSIDYVLIFRYRQTNRHFFVTNRGFQLTF